MYTVGPCLSILYVLVCTCQSQTRSLHARFFLGYSSGFGINSYSINSTPNSLSNHYRKSLCIRVTDILSLFVSTYFISKEINILVDVGRETESFSWDGRHHLEMADAGGKDQRNTQGKNGCKCPT